MNGISTKHICRGFLCIEDTQCLIKLARAKLKFFTPTKISARYRNPSSSYQYHSKAPTIIKLIYKTDDTTSPTTRAKRSPDRHPLNHHLRLRRPLLHPLRKWRHRHQRALSQGHESAGEVIALGSDVSREGSLHVGDKVALEVGVPCDKCQDCYERAVPYLRRCPIS